MEVHFRQRRFAIATESLFTVGACSFFLTSASLSCTLSIASTSPGTARTIPSSLRIALLSTRARAIRGQLSKPAICLSEMDLVQYRCYALAEALPRTLRRAGSSLSKRSGRESIGQNRVTGRIAPEYGAQTRTTRLEQVVGILVAHTSSTPTEKLNSCERRNTKARTTQEGRRGQIALSH
jgi:hypothetical protein